MSAHAKQVRALEALGIEARGVRLELSLHPEENSLMPHVCFAATEQQVAFHEVATVAAWRWKPLKERHRALAALYTQGCQPLPNFEG